jgi:hypothetical protein
VTGERRSDSDDRGYYVLTMSIMYEGEVGARVRLTERVVSCGTLIIIILAFINASPTVAGKATTVFKYMHIKLN